MMDYVLDDCPPIGRASMPVLNAKSIMEIVEKKEISIKTPRDTNQQHKGLVEDNLFDFGDALVDYTSDGGSIRINQGLATLMLIAATSEAPNRLLMVKKREAFEQVTAQAQSLLEKQREDYERQRVEAAKQHQEHLERHREALDKQHQEHLEVMRKQNELLQEEVKRTRELYAQANLQFEVTSPPVRLEESRALLVQATLTKNIKNKAERHLADYEMERSKRLQKEKDLEEAERRIKKLKDDITFMEESWEVVTKRPFLKDELDSPEMHAEKKAKLEEVHENLQAVKMGKPLGDSQGIKMGKPLGDSQGIKMGKPLGDSQGIKMGKPSGDSQAVKKGESSDSPSVKKVSSNHALDDASNRADQEVLELDSNGDIVSGKKDEDIKEPSRSRQEHKLDKSQFEGLFLRPMSPPRKTLLGEGGLHVSDEELVKQSLIAWRHHLRTQNRYRPDKYLPIQVHKTHIKILMSALSSFKNERVKNKFTKKAVLMYQHEQYSHMYKEYHVPAEACYPYPLMSKVDADRDILYRVRCAPLNAFYSMIMEDTPGYVPRGHWSKPPIQEPSRSSSRGSDRSASVSRSAEGDNQRSSKSPEHPTANPIKNLGESSSVKKQASSSSREPSSTKLDVLWGSTDHLSDRRFKNSQRGKRVIPIPGEEPGYTSESGNEMEDQDNSFYDPRMIPSDKTLLAEWLHKIKRIKDNDLPKEYHDMRREWLQKAEEERVRKGSIPTILYDVEPPWDTGRGLAQVRYNEWRVADFEKRIAALRERNAASCAKFDSRKGHGPRDGQGRR
jgi:hypothetical protein